MNQRKPRIPRRYEEPRVYEIGVDITEEQYQTAVQKIGMWFAESRNTKEPFLLAKQTLDRCLAGKKANGQPWWNAARMPLLNRVRTQARFDLETMQPVRSSPERQTRKRERDKKTAKIRKEKQELQAKNTLMTDELRDLIKKQGITYGQEVLTFFTFAEEQRWQEIHASYLREFPWLNSMNATAELNQLCDLHVMQERIRMDRASQKRKVDSIDAANIVNELNILKKAMGIHPEQLKHKIQEKTEDVSIGAAAAKLDPNQGEDFRQIRQRFLLEEILQIWQMYNTPRADGAGYQLDDDGVFALLRCRTCHCGGCGERNVAGFTAGELNGLLEKRGLIKLTRKEVTKNAEPIQARSDEGPASAGAELLS